MDSRGVVSVSNLGSEILVSLKEFDFRIVASERYFWNCYFWKVKNLVVIERF